MARTRFNKVLVANRGEIAVRILQALRESGYSSVAVYSEADADALHVRRADEAVLLGPAPPNESYLVIDKILDACRKTGAEAVHPGYGFLSENAHFARALRDAGIVFIGPSAEAIEAMGEKTRARELAQEVGVPVAPGSKGVVKDVDEALEVASRVPFPLLLKAAAGGGGKGMRLVESLEELPNAFRSCQREAANAFGDDSVYIEKFIVQPRHVEMQILADEHGNVRHLFERDCSIQRRHQKVIEEAPCPVLSDAVRTKMGQVAAELVRAVGYTGAGTIEFLLDSEQRFYFMEMNTRLQVEHPVTEMITGIDLVRAQLQIAQGEVIAWSQDELVPRGAAVECRIYAEDSSMNFLPCPGVIETLCTPSGLGIRNDSGYGTGDTVPTNYDPLISKLVTWGPDRSTAIARMRVALQDTIVTGIRTNIPFHLRVMEDLRFTSGDYTTNFLPEMLERGESLEPTTTPEMERIAILAAAIYEHVAPSMGSQSTVATHKRNGKLSPWRVYSRLKRLSRT
ncbi:MAG: acetyl-CoA carboxylase biotin carboxylase subunit [Deltaproteobacteria bacterium CG2_30_63_29]|nr:MAG: acetyl-CoA carboxylase biotin carboxylase subunit [Deltaproteobacteria bacterium CG2_30_63_29]PJB34268.1 MAG: acetyl-CoA carboxylase biotin carboxylase subunit [Deltaproteobacteria bacterium CG_4_9_14_3_um_filter_63_12]